MKKLLYCCIIALLALSCRKTNPDTTATAAIFPDKVGNSWLYQVNDTAYSFANPAIITQYNMTVTITDSVTLAGGIKANRWVYSLPGGNDTNYVFKKADTISFISNNRFAMELIRQYIAPLQLHQSWMYSFSSVNNVSVAAQATITVGQQQFENAFNIKGFPGRPDEIIGIDEWFEDYVGIVKRYVNTSGSNNPYKYRRLWTLLSYQVE